MAPRHADRPPGLELILQDEKFCELRNGQWNPPISAQAKSEQAAFQATAEDVAICSFPKSGTTWTSAIVEMLLHDADPDVLRKGGALDDKCPFFDHVPNPKSGEKSAVQKLNAMTSPRCWTTHLYYATLPLSVRQKAKIIYVYRNPKDVIVSMYHFLHASVAKPFQGRVVKMAEAFVEDDLSSAPYFDHLAGFWPLKGVNPRIHFVSYEELSQDFRSAVEGIAKFLNKELTEEQMRAVAEECGFHTMKHNNLANKSALMTDGICDWKVAEFMRAGEIGSWKDEFDTETNQRVDEWIAENLHRTELRGLSFVYK